jgi:hypothetical protein
LFALAKRARHGIRTVRQERQAARLRLTPQPADPDLSSIQIKVVINWQRYRDLQYKFKTVLEEIIQTATATLKLTEILVVIRL